MHQTHITVAAVLLATVVSVAHAQHAGHGAGSAPPDAPAAAAAPAAADGRAYRSVFEGYRRFDEQAVTAWRESNDQVGRIGGWKAYLRESQGDDAMPAGHAGMHMQKKEPADAKPEPDKRMQGGHAGHKQP